MTRDDEEMIGGKKPVGTEMTGGHRFFVSASSSMADWHTKERASSAGYEFNVCTDCRPEPGHIESTASHEGTLLHRRMSDARP